MTKIGVGLNRKEVLEVSYTAMQQAESQKNILIATFLKISFKKSIACSLEKFLGTEQLKK